MKTETVKLIEGREDVTLTSYIIDYLPMLKKNMKRPAVIVCPGGGYFDCSDGEGEPVAIAFNRMGYHAFVLKYSVYGGNAFEADADSLPEKKECINPAPMTDIARAFIYINEHAKEWQLDTEKIAICGFSAGAHNCAMYATHWCKPVITNQFKIDQQMLRPAACILGYAPTDYVYMKECARNDPAKLKLFSALDLAFLGKNSDDSNKILDASPARLVDKDVPPTFIWATSQDDIVPVEHSTLYATALAQNHIPFELHIFEEGSHGLSVADQLSACALSQINLDASKWVTLCEKWLAKRFALPLPEKAPWECM